MRAAHWAVVTLLLVMCGWAAGAKEAAPVAADPALERRVLQVSEELRCLVCQNETIAASTADLAVDLRGQIREQLRAGRSEDDIREYLVARYGEFVLYRPRVGAKTLLLWGGPFALLLVALAVLGVQVRRRRRAQAGELSEPERERARALLGSGGDAS